MVLCRVLSRIPYRALPFLAYPPTAKSLSCQWHHVLAFQRSCFTSTPIWKGRWRKEEQWGGSQLALFMLPCPRPTELCKNPLLLEGLPPSTAIRLALNSCLTQAQQPPRLRARPGCVGLPNTFPSSTGLMSACILYTDRCD